MLELASGRELWIALFNALVLGLWAVLPLLLLYYAKQLLAARRVRPEFSLRKSEAFELDRATEVYNKVRCRLAEMRNQGDRQDGFGPLSLADEQVFVSNTSTRSKISKRTRSICG